MIGALGCKLRDIRDALQLTSTSYTMRQIWKQR
jgi:hypothetical protein